MDIITVLTEWGLPVGLAVGAAATAGLIVGFWKRITAFFKKLFAQNPKAKKIAQAGIDKLLIDLGLDGANKDEIIKSLGASLILFDVVMDSMEETESKQYSSLDKLTAVLNKVELAMRGQDLPYDEAQIQTRVERLIKLTKKVNAREKDIEAAEATETNAQIETSPVDKFNALPESEKAATLEVFNKIGHIIGFDAR
ncbi:MAG: hypothetical protein LBQ27_05140 [Clostridiales bacterium]|jgi:hypothetical protein|nr:hypothetical protein [Clostridiales bacterium]